MTPKEKAIELVDKFYDKIEDVPIECGMYCLGGSIDKKLLSKQCTLVAVDEIIEATKTEIDRPDYNGVVLDKYWQDVKTEIENL